MGGKKRRAMEKKARRKKRGLNEDGTHNDKYANAGPGERERRRKSRQVGEAETDTGSPFGSTRDIYGSSSGGRSSSWGSGGSGRGVERLRHKAYMLYDGGAEAALLIGRDLPEGIGRSGRRKIDDGEGLQAVLISDVTNQEVARGEAHRASVMVKYVEIVGKGYVPAGDIEAHYNGAARHAFEVIMGEVPADSLRIRLVNDIVENAGKNIPKAPKWGAGGRGGRERYVDDDELY